LLNGIPKGATYEETLQALEDRFGDRQFAAYYSSHLKARTHRAGESLQLAHRAYRTQPEEHIRREAGKEFADGAEDSDIIIQLLLGGEKTVNEALRQALELQAVLLAAMYQKTSAKTFWGGPISPHLTQERKAMRVVELWRIRQLRE
jgi:hypothetical protein